MSYTPIRITTKDIETDEIEMDANKAQLNFDLISQETDRLDTQTKNVGRDLEIVAEEINTKLTPITAALLFG